MPSVSSVDDTLRADWRRHAVEAEILDLYLGVIFAALSDVAHVGRVDHGV